MSRLRVLLADDHDGFRRTMAAFLKVQQDVEVVCEAVDGNDAIELAERHRPDIVLIDINMPNQNGLEAAKAIKARHPQTRIIILSWKSGAMYRQMAAQYSADYFIDKASIKAALLTIICAERTNAANSAGGVLAA